MHKVGPARQSSLARRHAAGMLPVRRLTQVKVGRRVPSEHGRMKTGDIGAFCRPGAIQFAVVTLEGLETPKEGSAT